MRCAFLFVLCLWLVTPATAASPQFMAAYEQMLGDLSSEFPGKEPGYYDRFIVAGFSDLLKLGTREELGDSIATTLADTGKRPFWMASFALSRMLGPQFDRSKLVSAIRGNLEHYFVLDEVENVAANRRAAINMASTELCYYGTEDDVKLVKSFAAKVAKINPGLAQSLEMTVYDRVKVRELREKAVSANSASIQEAIPPFPTPPPTLGSKAKLPESAPTTPTDEPTSSTPWSIIVVLIVAATGLLWLLLKRRAK
jgi:hypothetical protein